VSKFLQTLAAHLDQASLLGQKLRGIAVYCRTGIRFAAVGHHAKVRGSSCITLGEKVKIGDFCWVEAVTSYGGKRYHPTLVIGDGVAMSDLTHISCIERIQIGNGCLLGSKIYIGDHHHGNTTDIDQILHVAPADRPLVGAQEIIIGEMTWIGDGVVILPGTRIGRCSVVGANSVVRVQEDRPALIAGVPARVIRYLDSVG